MKTYFCSDLHLGHINILKYEPCRLDAIYDKFFAKTSKHSKEEFKQYILNLYNSSAEADLKELESIIKLHDKMLIDNWNSVVSKDDTVWFLGDFCFGSTNIKNYINKLNGHIKLIKGNHDKKSDAFYREAGFEYVSNYPILLKKHFMLMHAPLDKFEPGFFYVYGHVHSSPNYETKTKNSICACVERHEFKPFLISDFDKYESKRIVYSTGGAN